MPRRKVHGPPKKVIAENRRRKKTPSSLETYRAFREKDRKIMLAAKAHGWGPDEIAFHSAVAGFNEAVTRALDECGFTKPEARKKIRQGALTLLKQEFMEGLFADDLLFERKAIKAKHHALWDRMVSQCGDRNRAAYFMNLVEEKVKGLSDQHAKTDVGREMGFHRNRRDRVLEWQNAQREKERRKQKAKWKGKKDRSSE